MTDTDSYLQSLMVTNPLQEPAMHSAIRALDLLPGSRGLDVGCGIGLQVTLLAEAVGAAGHVTGVEAVGVKSSNNEEGLLQVHRLHPMASPKPSRIN
ncbi:MAG: hypothetical protein U9N43_09410 [Euryarchaeota archaeon]|nr:hypothetical protein [Euryarchaeota archaeon]